MNVPLNGRVHCTHSWGFEKTYLNSIQKSKTKFNLLYLSEIGCSFRINILVPRNIASLKQ